MFDIQWKGKIGYGDIVSPICYAHNISFKLKKPVNLTFRWDHGVGRKADPSDPEQLWVRASYLFSKCLKKDTDVNLIHKFRNPLDCNHTGYDWDAVASDPFHNYWVSTFERRAKKGLIVVNSTEGNTQSLADYGKSWKDPVNTRWSELIDSLKKTYRIVVVDYRTTIEELCDVLNRCEFFIGYHGTAAWIAKFLMVPSIIFSSGGKLTRNSFHSAVILPSLDDLSVFQSKIDSYVEKGRINIKEDRQKYKLYEPNLRLIRSLVYHG
jgi:hypothetical protein